MCSKVVDTSQETIVECEIRESAKYEQKSRISILPPHDDLFFIIDRAKALLLTIRPSQELVNQLDSLAFSVRISMSFFNVFRVKLLNLPYVADFHN